MPKIILFVFSILFTQNLFAQNRLLSDKTWLVYENKGKNIVEQLIIKANGEGLFYQSNRFKLTQMLKDTIKSSDTKHFYILQGQKGEYEFLPGTTMMIARPELNIKYNWEVFESFTRINPDGSRSVFKLKR